MHRRSPDNQSLIINYPVSTVDHFVFAPATALLLCSIPVGWRRQRGAQPVGARRGRASRPERKRHLAAASEIVAGREGEHGKGPFVLCSTRAIMSSRHRHHLQRPAKKCANLA